MANIRPKSFEACIRQIKRELPGLIVSAYELGISRGERAFAARDFDIFVLARYRADIPYITQTIRRIARQKLYTTRTSLTDVLEDAALVENEHTNIHVLAIGRDELGSDYAPRSFRLRTIALLAGRDLPLYYFRQRARLMFGKRLPQRTPIPKPPPSAHAVSSGRRPPVRPRVQRKSTALQDRWFARWRARFCACLLPMAAALFVPLVRLSSNEFRVWCFKVILYQSDLIVTYLRAATGNRLLLPQDVMLDHDTIALATAYRQHPSDYYGSRVGLYAVTWRFLIGNLRLLWRSRRYLIIEPAIPSGTPEPAVPTKLKSRDTPLPQTARTGQNATPTTAPVASSATNAPSASGPHTTSSAE